MSGEEPRLLKNITMDGQRLKAFLRNAHARRLREYAHAYYLQNLGVYAALSTNDGVTYLVTLYAGGCPCGS